MDLSSYQAHHGESLLVVDDDPAIRTMLKAYFTKLGFAVDTADDGASALALLQSGDRSFDLILTDVRMPECSGPELVTRYRALHPAQAFLYMSGFVGDAFDPYPAERNMPLIPKPFDFQHLAKAVWEALHPHHAFDQAA